ncbi:hypothetical protein [Sphingobacterium mizutaii]|nr:hypothetical protein [Sphingobacterium mizutaii]
MYRIQSMDFPNMSRMKASFDLNISFENIGEKRHKKRLVVGMVTSL